MGLILRELGCDADSWSLICLEAGRRQFGIRSPKQTVVDQEPVAWDGPGGSVQIRAGNAPAFGILSNASGKRFPEGFTDAIDDDHSMVEFLSCTSWWDAAEAPGVSRGRGPAHA